MDLPARRNILSGDGHSVRIIQRLCWQIVPTRLGELMTDPDKAQAKRVGDAMMTMLN